MSAHLAFEYPLLMSFLRRYSPTQVYRESRAFLAESGEEDLSTKDLSTISPALLRLKCVSVLCGKVSSGDRCVDFTRVERGAISHCRSMYKVYTTVLDQEVESRMKGYRATHPGQVDFEYA